VTPAPIEFVPLGPIPVPAIDFEGNRQDLLDYILGSLALPAHLFDPSHREAQWASPPSSSSRSPA
jgi:hypothetical protein